MSKSGKCVAVAALDLTGDIIVESSARLFYTASATPTFRPTIHLCPMTLALLPQHIVHTRPQVIMGLSRYPATRGHTLILHTGNTGDIFLSRLEDFISILLAARRASSALLLYYNVERCALITNGGDRISLLPLHGLSKEWKPILGDSKEFHGTYPGYISSKDGPLMDAKELDDICTRVRDSAGFKEPSNNHFDGPADDQTLFAKVVRGELQQWRIWEDAHYIAFLTPFANTPGFTVLVPRAHLPSDIFSINEQEFSKLMAAAHYVGSILKQSFGSNRCGMIFEGYEIDYAHVKLIPILEGAPFPSSHVMEATFQDVYQGYVTSLDGPKARDIEAVSCDATELRKLWQIERLQPPKSLA